MIKGIHHVALKCQNAENYKETLRFYQDMIGMKVICSWGTGPGAATMLELNGDIIEIFASGLVYDGTGSINHFAFITDDPDECIQKIHKNGYSVTSYPVDVNLWLNEPAGTIYPLRVAFCIGPVGEEIEFFCERNDKIQIEEIRK